jgi:hypothetical protein
MARSPRRHELRSKPGNQREIAEDHVAIPHRQEHRLAERRRGGVKNVGVVP